MGRRWQMDKHQKSYQETSDDPLLSSIEESGYDIGDETEKLAKKIAIEHYISGIRSVYLKFNFLYDSEKEAETEEFPCDFEIVLATGDNDYLLSVDLLSLIMEGVNDRHCGPKQEGAAIMLESMPRK